jgi:hypothetical protein
MDKLITCPLCGSEFCYEVEQEQNKLWHCFGCGFASNSTQHIESVNLEQTESVVPELYRAIKKLDENGYYWYPSTINHPSKGMVFVDLVDSQWSWAGVKATPITEEEKSKFPEGATHKADMSTIQHFGSTYMEALNYIEYFHHEDK